jgi:hypothetical protein
MKNTYFISLILLVFCLVNPVFAQYEGDQIFDETYIHEIQITTSSSLDELFDLFFDEIFSGSYTYTIADVVIDGNNLDSIGVRVKGGISAFDSKRPLKLDFNEFVSGRKYDGLKKLNLHQGNMDPSFMREAIAYGLMRNAGVKTVRTSFAKVYVNGNYEGIYTLVEQIDDDFIHNNFASADGALYKTGFNGLELKYEVDNSFTYAEFETVINQIPIDLLHEQLPEYLDVESFLRFFIVEIFANAVDGPLTVDYNYYIYFEPKSETYVYIPWDYNLSLYGGINHPILPEGANFIFEKIKQNSTLTARFLNTFCQLLQYNFDEDRIQNRVTTYRNLLESEVQNDPYIDEIGDFNAGVSYLQDVVSARVQDLTAEMNNDFNPCDPLPTPIQLLDVVINEIVASNDSTSGIADPAGGYPDWIELYNNTLSDIPLTGFYLSNDINFLKHWRFPDDQVIPANDYLIIWADRDLQEEGLHTDFKLNKTRGDLYLSFENGEIIDFLSYEDQITNTGLARVPNGIGQFMMQATTFNASNDLIISTENQSVETDYKVYPNPAKKNITLEFYSSHSNSNLLQIFDLQGQLLWQTELQVLNGKNQVEVPLSQFSTGTYSLFLVDNEANKKRIHHLVIID